MSTLPHFVRGFVLSLLAGSIASGSGQAYEDVAFPQDHAVRFRSEVRLADHDLRTVRADRDGRVLVNTNNGLLKAHEGRLVRYRELAGIAELDHRDLELLGGKFVFLTDRFLLPLHKAGADYRPNGPANFTRAAPAAPGRYLLLSSAKIAEVRGEQVLEQPNPGFTEVLFDHADDSFIVYSATALARWRDGQLLELPVPAARIAGLVAVARDNLKVATNKGLYTVTGLGATLDKVSLPWSELTCITRDAQDRLWVGSTRGAFSLDRSGHINYYAGPRWLADDRVIDLFVDSRNDVYVLGKGGLSKIEFTPMTLADKAARKLDVLRSGHIRYGLVSDVRLPDGDYARARLTDSDNDGLWSAMYLAGEAYRLAVTAATDARENLMDGLDALERLVTITGIPGFEARTFELDGFKVSDPERWRTRPQRDFEWKGHTSSDEIVGTFFFYGVLDETIARKDPALRKRIAGIVGAITTHILDHRLYLVDIDGKPTTWGRWNPEYVNQPVIGGDRRLNSIEILSFLQLAFSLTGSQRFKDAFYELVNGHGYADNTVKWLPDPMGEWNHSDDELYWLSYYNLVRYCFDDKLKPTFLASARRHYEVTKRKRNPVWNFIYGGITGEPIDLDGSVWILREYPLDSRNWRTVNSHRGDIKIERRPDVEPEAVPQLPPDERRIQKWNGNELNVDGGGDGQSGESGAEYLLPYWMGRYYGYISAPRAAQ
ncbi:MAG TPA: hypothetical protein PKY77_13145 [Phycisphaerae bacterium]|nr:hypothetical protein [Phycisphaerae bacterium]HRY68114.1 hypothetical protein [Phycisphaerae bacterium]HSA28803.1 hypothetical protein [Phycisphaerae bacterium]